MTTTQKPTPMPWRILIVVMLSQIADTVALTGLAPYLAFLIKFETGKDLEEVGMLAGVLISSYYFAQFFSAFFWGKLSDRFGRRKIIIFGLAGSTITSAMFGFSRNVYYSIAVRFMFGVLNGNIGIIKTTISEVTDKTNQKKAFSLVGFSWGAGISIAPMVSGFLADPLTQYPGWFEDGKALSILKPFLSYFPFILPSVFSTSLTAAGLFQAIFFLPETNRNILRKQGKDIDFDRLEEEIKDGVGDEDMNDESNIDGNVETSVDESNIDDGIVEIENSDELDNEKGVDIHLQDIHLQDVQIAKTQEDAQPDCHGTKPVTQTPTQQASDKDKLTHSPPHSDDDAPEDPIQEDTLGNNNNSPTQSDQSDQSHNSSPTLPRASSLSKLQRVSVELVRKAKKSWLRSEVLKPTPLLAVMLYGFTGLVNIIYNEVAVLWAILPVKSGGIAFTASSVGVNSMISGLTMIVYNPFILPRIMNAMSLLTAFRFGAVVSIPLFALIPYINWIENRVLVWMAFIGVNVWRLLAQQLCFSAVMIIINNSVSFNNMGALNGIAQMTVALTRALGPTVCGTILQMSLNPNLFYPFNYHLVWIITSLLCAGLLLSSFMLDDSVNLPRDEIEKLREQRMKAQGLSDSDEEEELEEGRKEQEV